MGHAIADMAVLKTYNFSTCAVAAAAACATPPYIVSYIMTYILYIRMRDMLSQTWLCLPYIMSYIMTYILYIRLRDMLSQTWLC